MDIKTIVIIVSYILFTLIIGLSFWVGYKRGVKRSAISLGISLALIVIAFLITPPISNAILNIKVNSAGDSKPLSQLIIDILSEQPQIKTAIENSPTLRSFIEALPLVVMNVVVYLVLYFIMRLIGYIIYKIIEVTCLKSKQKEKELGLKRNGWAGGALSVAKTLIFIFLLLAPLNALLGLINDMETKTKPAYTASSSSSSSSIPSTEEILSNIPSVVTDGITAYENNVFGFLGSWFGLDNFVFDNLVKIKVDGEEINIRQDALSYAIVYNTYVEMSKAVSNPADESFVNVDWTRLDQSVNYIFESGLVRGVVANLFADFVKNYQEFEINFGQAQEILDCLKASIENKNVKDYFTNDLKQIYEAFSTAGKSGVLDTLLLDKTSSSTDKFEEIISIKNKDALKMVLSSALNMNIVKDAFSPILKLAVNQINSDKFDFSNSSTNVQNWEEFKKTILTSVDDLAEINSTLPLSTIVSQPVEILKLTKEKLSLLLSKTGSLLDNINNSGILVDEKGTKVLDKIFEGLGFGNIKSVNGNPEINSYESFFNYLKTPLLKLQEFDLYQSISSGADAQETFNKVAEKLSQESQESEGETKYSSALSDIILSLYKSESFRENILKDFINSSMKFSDGFLDLSKLEVYDGDVYNFEKSFENWKNECSQLTKFFVEAFKIKIGSGENERLLLNALLKEDVSSVIKEIPQTQIEKIINPALYLKSIQKVVSEALAIATDNINSITGKDTTIDLSLITLKEGDDEDQANEISQIIKKFIAVVPESGNISSLEDLSYSDLGSLLDAVKENAYRTTLNGKTESGLFLGLFNDFFLELKNTYPQSEKIIGSKNPWEISFTELLSAVEKIKNTSNTFMSSLDQIINKETITVGDIEGLVNSIDENVNKEEINDLIDIVVDSFDYNIQIPGDTEEQINQNKETISNAINSNANIDDITKQKIKGLLGLL